MSADMSADASSSDPLALSSRFRRVQEMAELPFCPP